jgi:hypothetical protein
MQKGLEVNFERIKVVIESVHNVIIKNDFQLIYKAFWT